VQDSRGNKVFKKATQTDKFGIASAEFELADEVNLGTYHLRAAMGTEEAGANTAELALNVERYVLPKFKVAIDFASKDNRAKRGYRPGDHVTGTVRANYFFGKPVDGAEIDVKASGMDVAQFEAGVRARQDRSGKGLSIRPAPAELLRGAPAEPWGRGRAHRSHCQRRGRPCRDARRADYGQRIALIVTAVPEGGTLIPNLENQVFVVTAYPDGTPAVATVKVHADGNPEQSATTDDGGVAVVKLRAGAGQEKVCRSRPATRKATTPRLRCACRPATGAEQILLRTEHAVYRAGDRIALRVFSTKSRGTAYVDVVKEGQTVLTRDLDIVNGQAELALTATPDLAGTVDIHAYLFGQDARPVGDHRLVFVQPADELKIEATADATAYKPGDEARIRFRVTNGRGEGVEAALGVQVVDEAVFALAEKQPGMAKVFFYLEQEAMKPRYEIHSLGMPEIVEPVPVARAAQRDRAARALFAATEMVSRNKFETEFGRTVPMAKYAEYAERYQQRYARRCANWPKSSRRIVGRTSRSARVLQNPLFRRALRDPWATTLRVESVNITAKRPTTWCAAPVPTSSSAPPTI
jgi:hypothetical protein